MALDYEKMMQMMMAMRGQPQQGPDIVGMIEALNAPSAAEQQRIGYVGSQLPSYMGTPTNPFNSGFFKSADERKQIETERLGTPGFSSLSPGQQAGALGSKPAPNASALASAASPSPWQMMGQLPGPLPPVIGGIAPNPEQEKANLFQNMMLAQNPTGFWNMLRGVQGPRR